MRLIDADKLKALFEHDDDVFKSQDIRHIIDVGTETINDIVQCKDCKYWREDDSAHGRYFRCHVTEKLDVESTYNFSDENWFCPEGERKETDNVENH